MQKVKLNNGVEMPILGYGTFLVEQKVAQRCVEDALNVGYRLIDTAQVYANEEGVGAALKNAMNGGTKREELFIETKVWINHIGESATLKAFDNSLKKLGLDYVDLYLIHQPFNDLYGAWRAMSRLYKEGRIKAIGVSNFYPDRLTDFCLNNEIKPSVNQIEGHPLLQQNEAQEVMKKYGVQMQFYSPFMQGKGDILKNKILANIGKKYNKSVAQVILRWLVQRGVAVAVKSVNKERMLENISVFDFELDANDMQAIAELNKNQSHFDKSHRDVEQVLLLHTRKPE
ncbi:aldo/keto reductase [Brachyspira catarrhinii]|uniref:Aldo/keto reductase n=1 Tax=Brachyspira catarrhinii TaxID=2528966 RepID=A0ABY2TQP8_9SPIR|nr:aldo/keto reductase [Brachyspira catarrhinii]TKZ35140.1 aldo/keto reductase [Brachyspira catarrhinii]